MAEIDLSSHVHCAFVAIHKLAGHAKVHFFANQTNLHHTRSERHTEAFAIWVREDAAEAGLALLERKLQLGIHKVCRDVHGHTFDSAQKNEKHFTQDSEKLKYPVFTRVPEIDFLNDSEIPKIDFFQKKILNIEQVSFRLWEDGRKREEISLGGNGGHRREIPQNFCGKNSLCPPNLAE